MQPHQQRVIEEKSELSHKLTKLNAFMGIGSENPPAVFNNLDEAEQSRLKEQAGIMELYVDVLDRRIKAF